jgi:hypothetical protein
MCPLLSRNVMTASAVSFPGFSGAFMPFTPRMIVKLSPDSVPMALALSGWQAQQPSHAADDRQPHAGTEAQPATNWTNQEEITSLPGVV